MLVSKFFFLVFFKAVPLAFIFEPLSCYSIVTFNAVLWSWSHLSHNSHNGSIKVAKIEDVINTSADFLLNAISIYFLFFEHHNIQNFWQFVGGQKSSKLFNIHKILPVFWTCSYLKLKPIFFLVFHSILRNLESNYYNFDQR